MSAAHHESAGFRVKALYTVPELATLIGMHHRTLRRWLARKQVPLLHVGASVAVPLVVFRDAFPELWASPKAMHEPRQGACPVAGVRRPVATDGLMGPDSLTPANELERSGWFSDGLPK